VPNGTANCQIVDAGVFEELRTRTSQVFVRLHPTVEGASQSPEEALLRRPIGPFLVLPQLETPERQ